LPVPDHLKPGPFHWIVEIFLFSDLIQNHKNIRIMARQPPPDHTKRKEQKKTGDPGAVRAHNHPENEGKTREPAIDSDNQERLIQSSRGRSCHGSAAALESLYPGDNRGGEQSENKTEQETGHFCHGSWTARHQTDAANNAKDDAEPFGNSDHFDCNSLGCPAK
jgi:hypothetical protein